MEDTIKINRHPDPLASFSEKKTNEYGLQIAKLISGDWFNGGMIDSSCQFTIRRNWIRNKRLFVRGESGTDYYKNFFKTGDKTLDYLNIDWSQINWAEKFALIVSNGISDENYKLDIRSIDRTTSMKNKEKQDFYKKYMASKQMLEQIKQEAGMDLMPDSSLPEDEEEMQLYMEMKERPKIEIAEESIIDFVKNTNDWKQIEEQKNKDVVNIGIISARVWIDKNDGVKVQYIDPEFYIHSRVKRNDFSDKYYEGYIETITLSDFVRESGCDQKTARKIANSYSRSNTTMPLYSNYEDCPFDDLLDYKIDVLRFAYKTVKNIKYKAKKRKGKIVSVAKRDDSWKDEDKKDVGTVGKTLDTWFEGNYVIGTEYVYDYKECENLYDDQMNKALSPFITMAVDIYENRLKSFTDNIEAPVIQLQKIHLKIQQLVQELKPDIIEIDVDTLAELDDGKGGVKKEIWETALTLMGVKGVVFKKRINMGDEGIKDQSAVRPYATQQGSALAPLLNVWAHYYNLIRENTGVNPARDGSLPADALVGVNQMAQLASNTVTRNIVETAVSFNKKVCEVISSRVHTIYRYKDGKKLRELYDGVVSKHLMDSMEVMKDRHLHEFGFVFDMMPTNQDIQEFKEALTIAVQEQTIDVEEKIEAERVAKSNIKLANQYLMYKRRNRIKQRQQEQMMMAEHKSMNDAKAAQAKVEAESQAYQFKKQVDLQYEAQLAQIQLMKERGIKEINAPYEDKEFQQDVYLKQIETYGMLNKEKLREDRKDERVSQQSTQQSKMIEQRQNNAPAIDFENNFEDLLSGGI